jgi:hypothetical protein
MILDIHVEWLTSGEGHIYKEGGDPQFEQHEQREPWPEDKRSQLVRAVKNLPDTMAEEDIDALLKVVEKFSRRSKEGTT